MLMGEIDCREGLLLAVDKDRYRDLDEAVETIVDIYSKLLIQLVDQVFFYYIKMY